MSSGSINIPEFGSASWKDPVDTVALLPVTGNQAGDARVAIDTSVIYVWSGSTWVATGGGGGGGTIVSINGDGTPAQVLVTGAGGTDFTIIDSGTGSHIFNIPSSSATARGLLTSTDWSTFNNKQNALTTGNITDGTSDGISITGGTGAVIGSGVSISQQQSSASQNGYLSSADWSVFSGKSPALTFAAPLVNTANTISINGVIADNKLSFVAAADATKQLSFNLGGQSGSTTVTVAPLATANTTYNIQPNVDATANIITQNATSGQIFIGTNASIGGSNSGIQYSNATTANRGQIRLGSYVNATSVAGVTTATSRSGTVGVNAPVVAGQDYSKWTAQAGATTPGSLPISGAWAFKANTVNSLTVTSDFHLQLTNLAGTLADTLYLSSEGLLQLPGYTAGIATFDASGNVTSAPVAPASISLTNSHILVGNASNVAADVAASGDLTLANTGAFTLNTVNSSVGTYGTASNVASVTLNGKGLVTSASNILIQIAESQVTNLVTDLASKANVVLPTTNQMVFVNSLAGSNVTGTGSYDNPYATVAYAMTQITDASSTKPYVIALQANRQVETTDVFMKPYTFIVGQGQRAAYMRINGGGALRPDPSHATANSWVGLYNLYLGGSSPIIWDLQALGGSNCEFIIQNCTVTGSFTYKGRNSGGGDYLEAYDGILFGPLTLDSTNCQMQGLELVNGVTVTNTQAGPSSCTFESCVFDTSSSVDSTTVNMYNNAYGSGVTLTTTGTMTINSFRGLPSKANRSFSGTTTVVNIDDATAVPYTPTTSSNFNTVPTDASAALDSLAVSGIAKTQSANTVLAGPSTGASALPTFRALVAADIPSLPYTPTTLPSGDIFVGNASNVATAVAASGDVILANTGAFTIAANVVSNSKLAQMPANTIKGNNTGGTANAADLTGAQVTAILSTLTADTVTTAGAQGLVPAPAANTTESGSFLTGSGFKAVDQSKPNPLPFSLFATAPATAGTIKFQNVVLTTINSIPYAVASGGNSVGTMSIYNISNQAKPVLKSAVTLSGSYNISVANIAGVPYAIIPSSGASTLIIYNISDPTNPTLVVNKAITGSPGSIYDAVYNSGYIYLATQSTGLVVLDVGGGSGSLAAPVQVYQQGAYKSFGIGISGSTLFTTGFSAGTAPYAVRTLLTWNISTPSAPTISNTYTYASTSVKPGGMSINGNTMMVTDLNLAQYYTMDITTPTSPSLLSTITTTSGAINSAFRAYISGKYLYAPWGSSATLGGGVDFFDVTSLSSPVKVATVSTGVGTAVFGNIALDVTNGYIYCADYGVAPGSAGNLDVFTMPITSLPAGAITASTIALKTGAGAGYVLTSDASGNATWAASPGASYAVQTFTLSSTDITNGYVTLAGAPSIPAETLLTVVGGPMQDYGVDFVVSGSQLTWSAYALQGVLAASDILIVQTY
jgi:hypothetical protein